MPRILVDKEIEKELLFLRKTRFIPGFDNIQVSVFARKLIEGDYRDGTADIRCRALSWGARILSYKEKDNAAKILDIAKGLGHCQEIDIAIAFLKSAQKDKKSALSILADINSPMSSVKSSL